MSTVRFRDLVKGYGVVKILSDLQLDIAEGEFMVLLGPSGCGKTTLLNLLAGLMEPDSGHIEINGKDVTYLDPCNRGLAMVFQSYALYPTKTVRGNLTFALTARGLPKDEIEKRVEWAARMLKLETMLDRKPSQLSGGQRQRVAIGRALVRQVGLFLFDEPLSNLDAKLRTEMRIEIKKLHQELKNTVVYVTHDQVEAMTMATRIAVMNRGVIEQVGTPSDIYDRPASIFVADFVGSPAMNFIQATIKIEESRVHAKLVDQDLTIDLTRYHWTSKAQDGSKITLGVRPENIVLQSGQTVPQGQVTLIGDIQHLERSGAEAVAFVHYGAARALAIRAEHTKLSHLTIGEKTSVLLPLDALNVFDSDSGRRH